VGSWLAGWVMSGPAGGWGMFVCVWAGVRVACCAVGRRGAGLCVVTGKGGGGGAVAAAGWSAHWFSEFAVLDFSFCTYMLILLTF
jgi:hypothetical protein